MTSATHCQTLTILGSTGSIGVSTLDVVAQHPQRFQVFALTAESNVERLAQQCEQFKPSYAVIGHSQSAQILRQLLKDKQCPTEVLVGSQALVEVASASEVDMVMAAIVGAAGLMPTLAAANAGKKVLLANKEALVMAGDLFMAAVQGSGATLLPIDSEHNAIFQCMPANYQAGAVAPGVRKLILTGSGGPFRTWSAERIAQATPEQACNHPNWSMGRKISVDSATLMNKGLELIEARWLFELSPDRIQVVVHPQSIIHSMVEYEDGSILAQMGNPDMRIPIAHALAWPERIESGVESLDLLHMSSLEFEAPDHQRFPALSLAINAASAGQGSATALNAANEVAVAAFLSGQISFNQISQLLSEVMSATSFGEPKSLEDVTALDSDIRQQASTFIRRLTTRQVVL